jgi:dihydrofolate reductase
MRAAGATGTPRVTVIVARARNGVIGLRNTLPWHLPEDLRHFKAATLGHAVIMGRRTFDSIGRPLPGRRIVVLSRDPDWRHEGCEHAASLPEALALVAGLPEAFIAGGAEIYRIGLAHADRLLITDIELDPEGDAWFDEPDPAVWRCLSRQEWSAASGLRYAIRELVRRVPAAASVTMPAQPL